MSSGVRVAEWGSGSGRIGHLTLDTPKTLNSLTLDMVDVIADCLETWAVDTGIAAVFIDGEGEKAFCAGGDVQALRASSLATPGGPCSYAETFFAHEYRMNYLLHRFPKPVVCWGHGVVMGGGLGILAACSHRVVSERTRIAMPEITIALFPDVGGSWFLNRMPGHSGRFLALTAVSINAADALYCGLGSHFIDHASKDAVLDALVACDWDDGSITSAARVDAVLAGMPVTAALPEANVEPHQSLIDALMAGDDLVAIVNRVLAWDGEDPWMAKARDGLAHGSKLAASWIFRQLKQTRDASLETVFASELRLGANIMRHTEFAEGVRALLVDKDRNPRWLFARVEDVPAALLDGFFTEPDGLPDLNLPESL